MKFEHINYPDGSGFTKVTQYPPLDPILTHRINTHSELFQLASIVDCYKYHHLPMPSLFIPCMFQQQHDRRFNENESFELKIVCDFINNLGFPKVYIYHPHSDVTPALINNSIVIDNSEHIKRVLNELLGPKEMDIFTQEESRNLILMSTDAGGFKPLMKLADKIGWQGEVFSASKARKYENGKSSLIQQIDRTDFQGKDILIIDDLCVKGGTFIGLAEMLREKNCGRLYLAFSHLTVKSPNPYLSFVYDKIFLTNSKYQKEEYDVDINYEFYNISSEILNLY